MSKINLETFKKLLSVKKGGAEFFRFVVKAMFWIFIIGAVFYGLVWIPNQKLNLEIMKINIDSVKTQRGCEAYARQITLQAVAEAKKAEKEVSQEDQNNFMVSKYNECIYLAARDDLLIKKQAVEKKPKSENAIVK